MQVQIREGGDGVSCWNDEAIRAYARDIDARETAIGDANPDVSVSPGLVKCWGCEVLEYDMGTRCTATLQRTLFAVTGEVAPRDEDAKTPINDIPGLVSRIDAEAAADLQPEYYPAAPTPETPERPRGLRGLLHRR